MESTESLTPTRTFELNSIYLVRAVARGRVRARVRAVARLRVRARAC